MAEVVGGAAIVGEEVHGVAGCYVLRVLLHEV